MTRAHALQKARQPERHQAARDASEQLRAENALLVTTDYILDETYTLLRSTLGHRSAIQFEDEIQSAAIQVVQVDEALQREAWAIFERYSDKDFSFTDCTSFAVMEKGKIRAAFTLDHHFRQYGFETLPALPSRRRR